jgi:hypothetical protein
MAHTHTHTSTHARTHPATRTRIKARTLTLAPMYAYSRKFPATHTRGHVSANQQCNWNCVEAWDSTLHRVNCSILAL